MKNQPIKCEQQAGELNTKFKVNLLGQHSSMDDHLNRDHDALQWVGRKVEKDEKATLPCGSTVQYLLDAGFLALSDSTMR